MKKVQVTIPTKEESRVILGHPVVVAVLTAFIGWLGLQAYGWNTTDDEVQPTISAVVEHETRLNAEETNTTKVAKQLEIQAVQTAFTGRKMASQDIRRIQQKPRDQWSVEEANDHRDAESRLEYNQRILDEAMGMPD